MKPVTTMICAAGLWSSVLAGPALAQTGRGAAQDRGALRLLLGLFRYRRDGERRSHQNGDRGFGGVMFGKRSNSSPPTS